MRGDVGILVYRPSSSDAAEIGRPVEVTTKSQLYSLLKGSGSVLTKSSELELDLTSTYCSSFPTEKPSLESRNWGLCYGHGELDS
jgi:hypothetical protein